MDALILSPRGPAHRCVVCHDDGLTDPARCPGCGATYHRPCRSALRGRCATPGCRRSNGRPQDARSLASRGRACRDRELHARPFAEGAVIALVLGAWGAGAGVWFAARLGLHDLASFAPAGVLAALGVAVLVLHAGRR